MSHYLIKLNKKDKNNNKTYNGKIEFIKKKSERV
jgi:hypothetical protein